MVDSDIRLRKAFPKPPMVCYKRPRNIKEIICRSRLPPMREVTRKKQPGFRRCNKQGCRLCPFTGIGPTEVVTSITINHSGEQFNIKVPIDCKTDNVLYMLECRRDREQYVGETGRTIEKRFVGHLDSVRNNTESTTSVGEHFREQQHSVQDMRGVGFERIRSSDIWVRKAREREYINKWDLIRTGLNKKL